MGGRRQSNRWKSDYKKRDAFKGLSDGAEKRRTAQNSAACGSRQDGFHGYQSNRLPQVSWSDVFGVADSRLKRGILLSVEMNFDGYTED